MQVRLLLLAGLASEHLLLLGPPGTAKSELSRRLSKLTSGRYYERLLTRFSVPEELFGPLSMRGDSLLCHCRPLTACFPCKVTCCSVIVDTCSLLYLQMACISLYMKLTSSDNLQNGVETGTALVSQM